MPTQRVWYPDSITMPTGNIAQMSDQTPEYGYEDFQEFTAGEYGPGFVGATQAMPNIQLRTRQIKSILDQCTEKDICGNLTDDGGGPPNPYTLRMFFRAGKPQGVREADDEDTLHHVVDMVESAFLTWDSFSCEQGQAAEINCRFDVAALNLAVAGDPFLWTGVVPANIPAEQVLHVYTQGPINLMGARIGGVNSIRWENNIVRETQSSDGDAFPTLQGIRTFAPTITMMTTDISLLDLFIGTDKRGAVYDSTPTDVYLRRMDQAQIHYADGSAQHIKFSMDRILARARRVNSNPAQVEIELKPFKLANQEMFSVNTATTIV